MNTITLAGFTIPADTHSALVLCVSLAIPLSFALAAYLTSKF